MHTAEKKSRPAAQKPSKLEKTASSCDFTAVQGELGPTYWTIVRMYHMNKALKIGGAGRWPALRCVYSRGRRVAERA